MQLCLKTWCEFLLKHIITADGVIQGTFRLSYCYDQYQENWGTSVNDHPALTIIARVEVVKPQTQ